MEPIRTEVSTPIKMELELTRLPKRKERINLLTGVFLKSVHFLDPELTKCIIAGVFKNRGDSLGLVFKGRKGSVFWSHDAFNQLSPHFNEVTLALEGKGKHFFRVDTGEDIKINNVFGRQYVYLYDGEHSLALNSAEWHQFVNNLPSIYSLLKEIFYLEDLVKTFINQIITEEDSPTPPQDLPTSITERLFNEVSLYKRYPNGNSG